MERCEQVTQIIYDAMREIDLTLPMSPKTVLMGEAGTLDSLAVVNLLVAIEQRVDRTFHESVSLMDGVLADDRYQWTVAAFATYIAERVDAGARQRPAAKATVAV